MVSAPEPPWSFPFTPAPPEWALDWDGLVAALGPWLDPMRGCRQEPDYHAEGDVFVHTRMACEALSRMPGFRSLDEPARSVVFAGALLHDVGKPATTREDADRISSRGHARKGVALTRELFWSGAGGEIPLGLREQVAGLVRWHAAPMYFHEGEDPTREVLRLAENVRSDWLALVAEADMRGRACRDQPDLLAQVDLFRAACREAGCLSGPRTFPDPHSRYLYLRGERPAPEVPAFDDTRCEVWLLAGLPGAGTDTWLAANHPGWPVVSLDAIRGELGITSAKAQGHVTARARDLALEHLRAGRSFVWNATNLTRRRRMPLVDVFRAYGARTRIVYVEAPLPIVLRRNARRRARVPDAVIRRLAAQLEVPDPTEAHRVDLVDGCRL